MKVYRKSQFNMNMKVKPLYFVLGYDKSERINLKKQYHYEKIGPTTEKDSENESTKIGRRVCWKTKSNSTMPNSLHTQTSQDETYKAVTSSHMIVTNIHNRNENNSSNIEDVSNSTNTLSFSDSNHDAQLDCPSTTIESFEPFNVKSEIEVEENFTEVSINFLGNPRKRKRQSENMKLYTALNFSHFHYFYIVTWFGTSFISMFNL